MSACQAGTTLTPSGSITVTTAGTVIDGKDVTGEITVSANNVTIKNTPGYEEQRGAAARLDLRQLGHPSDRPVHGHDLLRRDPHGERRQRRARHPQLLRGQINVDHVLQATDIDALCWCGNANLQDNYSKIHLAIANDHLENLYLDGHTLTANHNTFLNDHPQTANIFANVNNGSGGACSNHLTVTNNLLAGGGWSIYPCGNGTSQGTSTTTITGNRFARCGSGIEVQGGGGTWFCPGGPDQFGYFPRGGSFGVVAAYFPNMVWSGNYWDDNLKTFCANRSLGCP